MRLEDIQAKPGHALGIDVSVFQGAIDWSALPENVRFAFIRATNGLQTDRRFASNAAGCRVPWGAYHALAYGSDPVAQARHFAATIAGREIQLPPVLDFEVARPGEKASECVARGVTCMREIEQLTGQRCIVYTYPSFFQRLHDLGADVSPFGERPLWIAHYGRTLKAPTVPRAWSTWQIWQWYGGGLVKLPNGADVDVNWWSGTVEELAAFECYGA